MGVVGHRHSKMRTGRPNLSEGGSAPGKILWKGAVDMVNKKGMEGAAGDGRVFDPVLFPR